MRAVLHLPLGLLRFPDLLQDLLILRGPIPPRALDRRLLRLFRL